MARHVHKVIAETAKSMAGEIYESMAESNDWYKRNPSRSKFVKAVWPTLVDEARATLARMLALPGGEELKETIADALIKDNALQRGLEEQSPQLMRPN